MARTSKTSSASSGQASGRGSRGTSRGTARRRFPVVWLLIAVILTAAVSIGAAAFLLPDRHPAILSRAKEVASAPVAVQRYDGNKQISVIPTLSASRQVLVNTSGTVTADHSGEGLVSGRAALAVDGRPIVALATATPLYRGLKSGDHGGDVRALNDELARLGYGAPAGSDRYTWDTAVAVAALRRAVGAEEGVTLPIEDVIWLPQREAAVSDWNGVPGAMITAGTPIGRIPGALTAISLRDGAAENADRTITVFGQQGLLKAGATRIDDPEFCARVTASPEFRMFVQSSSSTQSVQGQSSGQSSVGSAGSVQQGAAQGVNATVALAQPVDVMRVPAAAVFGVDGGSGCIASGGRTIPVTVVGADLGVSLVRPADGSEPSAGPSTVQVGSAIRGLTCPRA